MVTKLCPPYLIKGDRIALIAPAKHIDPDNIRKAKSTIAYWGLEVQVGANVLSVDGNFAGTDHERAADLQWAINDPAIKAILCIRGGYGCIRLLHLVDFSPLKSTPKWLIGFSDITVLHALFNDHLDIQSIHGTMPINFENDLDKDTSADLLRQVLFGAPIHYVLPKHPLQQNGQAKGKLIGGNLSLLQSISGTCVDIIPDGAVLFIEDIDEEVYSVDRMLQTLQASGKLDRLAGVIVGGFSYSKMDQNYAKLIYSTISNNLPKNIPVCFGFPAGHQSDNRPLVLGRTIVMEIGETCLLKQDQY